MAGKKPCARCNRPVRAGKIPHRCDRCGALSDTFKCAGCRGLRARAVGSAPCAACGTVRKAA